MAARLKPGFDGTALRGVRVGAGHIGDQQPGDREPFLDVHEVIGDRGRNIPFGQERGQPQAGMVVVVSGGRAGWKTAGDEMRPGELFLCHGMTSPTVRCLQIGNKEQIELPPLQ